MCGSADRPSSIEQRLLEEPRRTAGVDGSGEAVRLGERDSGGHIVGYVDEQGLAWESLRERILAVSGARLAEALALPYDDARRDELMGEVLETVPDVLLVDVAREAAGYLWLSQLGREFGDR
jgi:hypothetical protein